MKSRSLHRIRELLEALERTTGDPGDLTIALQHIAQTAQTFFSADTCVIFAINPITNRYIESLTVAGNLLRGNKVPYKEPSVGGLAQQVLRQGVLVVEDLEVKPEYESTVTRTENIRAFVALALYIKHHRHPLGVLYLNFRQPQQFGSDDEELFQLFADQASYILQETWLLQRYQEVARIGQEINQELSTADNLFQKLQQYVGDILDTSYALLLAVYQPQTSTLDLYLEEEGRSLFLENAPLEGACRYVIETLKPLFIRQMSNEAETLPFKRVEINTEAESKESLIFVPLTSRDVPLGVLSIQHPQPNAYNQEDLFILQLLANHIALALYNLRLYENLSRLNQTGQLLTQQLDSEQVLQATADNIQTATKADVVVLYPYEPTLQRFVLPPRIAGTLLDSTSLRSPYIRPNGVVHLALHHNEPIFAKESATIYKVLQGNDSIQQESFGQREKIRSTVIVPLQVRDESVGVLFVNFRQPQRFGAAQKIFIEGLAHYAAIAIKNAQTFGTLNQRRVRELEILQNIDRELNRTLLDLKAFLNTVLKHALEHVPAEEASILLYNPRIQTLEIPAAIGPEAEARLRHVISIYEARGITRWVFEHKKPARVDNVHRDPQWQKLYIEATPNTVSELDVPLLDGEEVVGVLNFESTRERAFSEEDEYFLLTLAGQTVLAIKNAQAYEREKRFAAEAQVLNEISKEITSQLDPTHVLDLILEKALELTHSHMGNLMLYDPELDNLLMATERGVAEDKKDKRQGLDQGIEGIVARNKQLLNVVDVTQPPWDEIFLQDILGTRSELAVPMLAGNELRGVLNVESPNPNNFSERDQRLLQGLADLAVVALQNAERYEKAEKETQRLTLLYQAGQALSKITDLSQLEQAYDTVLHIAEEQSQSLVVIRRYDKDTQELEVIRASQPQYPGLYRRTKLNVGINGQVARERHTIVIHDINNPSPGIVPPQASDTTARSRLITPISFEEQYYGNLGLNHKDVGHFQGADILFFEGLAQQLASTILRLETVQARQESEQRALATEEMSSIGQSAFEVTHRLGNDLGLVELYINDIQSELEKQAVMNTIVSKKLENILQSVQAVLSFSRDIKQKLARLGANEEMAGEPTLISPGVLLEEASIVPTLPSSIQICLEIDEDVATVSVLHSLVADILRNLVANAIQAMPEGGKITLRAHNTGHSVALEVSDTGVGIPPQKLDNIFDLFFSTKGSSGFGLWSARRNALKNHGDLEVKSKPGQGTTFILLLPRTNGRTS